MTSLACCQKHTERMRVAPSLTAFALTFGWEMISSVPSPHNQHFVQFAFRRK